MNTLKFSPIYGLREETHNVDIYNINKVTIAAAEYECYSNLSVSILTTNKCNATCKFCSSKDIKDSLKDDAVYFSRLEYVLDQVKHLNPTVIITGGEPTISHRLERILQMVKNKNLSIRTFATNGYGLTTDKLRMMLSNDAIHNINISLIHYDYAKNKELMGYNSLSDDRLETIARFCNTNSMDVRLSCILMKSGISTFEDVKQYLHFAKQRGIDSVMFRELMGDPDDEVNISSTVILSFLADSNVKFIRTMLGFQYNVDVYKYKDYLVKHYHDKNMEDAINKNVVRNIVMQPDCTTYVGFRIADENKLIDW